jgi:sec-independent protein translocase protein TatA
MPNIGPLEVIIVLAIALMVLGPKKLPDVGRSIGRGLREFKESVSGRDEDDRDAIAAPISTKDVQQAP